MSRGGWRQGARARGTARARRAALALAAVVGLAAAGCRRDMFDQPRYEPYERSDFFADGQADRPIPAGTVAHETAPAAAPRLDRALLERGRERYDIYCSPCHDRTGAGNGMIVRRGYRQPPSLHLDRLRQAPDAYLLDVIGNGFGAMPAYRTQIAPADRHAIVAFMRALQRSQHAALADVPPGERPRLLAVDR